MNLEQQRKRAKDLRRAHERGDRDALERVAKYFDVTRLTLAQAQLVVAREAGFESWPKLVHSTRGLDALVDDVLAGRRIERPRDVPVYLAAALGERVPIDDANRRYARRDWPLLLYTCCARYGHDDPTIVTARVTLARELLARGADVNARGRETWFSSEEVDGFDVESWCALAGAAGRVGSPELVQVILDAGPHLDHAPALLKHAVWSRNPCVLELALAAKPPWWQVIWALELCAQLDLPQQARMLVPHAESPKVLEPGVLRAIREHRGVDLIAILLGAGGVESTRRAMEDAAYRAARRYGHDAAAELLRARGASESIIRPEDLVVPPPTDDAGIVVDDDSIEAFERAADAVARGDVDMLRELLDDEPDLVRVRSPRGHRCSLLHYCGANGTEAPRQRTPANAPAIMQLLLDRGADPSATCKLYGGGATTMNLLVTSVHPREAKLDGELVRILLEHGARLEQADVDVAVQYASPLALQAFVDGGAPITLLVAVALGRIDLVPPDADVNARFADGYTALHAAAGMGHAHVVRYLLDRGADRSVRDTRWEGTAADKARYFEHPAIAELIDRYPD